MSQEELEFDFTHNVVVGETSKMFIGGYKDKAYRVAEVTVEYIRDDMIYCSYRIDNWMKKEEGGLLLSYEEYIVRKEEISDSIFRHKKAIKEDAQRRKLEKTKK